MEIRIYLVLRTKELLPSIGAAATIIDEAERTRNKVLVMNFILTLVSDDKCSNLCKE